MDDLISRAAAKAAIRSKFQSIAERCEINEVLNSVPTVDAVPVDWMKRIQDKCVADVIQVPMYVAIGWLIDMWQKEQEAR